MKYRDGCKDGPVAKLHVSVTLKTTQILTNKIM